MNDTFENDYVLLEKRDNIMQVKYKPESFISIDAAKKVVEDRLGFANGQPMYVVAEVSNIKNSTKDAREYLSDKDGGLQGIIAGAFISNKVYTYFILNLFFKIVKPTVPTKFFTDRDKAMEWIEEMKSVN